MPEEDKSKMIEIKVYPSHARRAVEPESEQCNLYPLEYVPASTYNAVMKEFARIHLRIYNLGLKVLGEDYMKQNSGNEDLSDTVLDHVEKISTALAAFEGDDK